MDSLFLREQKEFESYLSIAGAVPSAVTVIAHAIVGHRFSAERKTTTSLVSDIF